MQGTGDYRKHDVASRLALAGRAITTMEAAKASGQHLWVATVAYRIADPTNKYGVLDHESLFTPPTLGCFICERQYEPGMERTRCPGDPTDQTTDLAQVPAELTESDCQCGEQHIPARVTSVLVSGGEVWPDISHKRDVCEYTPGTRWRAYPVPTDPTTKGADQK